jgi:pimeloyl-ACP methyl ester carboxylesterase
MVQSLDRMDVNGVELEYEVVGTGTPVVLIHGSFVADAFKPLSAQPELRDRLQLIRYHRRGYARSTPATSSVSIPEQAADCAGLLRSLGVGAAHVVGHSYGGVIALQVAVDWPDQVRSLALLEPSPLFLVPGAQAFMDGVAPVIDAYQKGDKKGAVVGFHQGFWGPTAETVMESLVPGCVAQATADADTFFQVEMPALQEWNLSSEQAARVRVPVLFLRGERTWPIFLEVRDLVHQWLPQTRDAVISGASHPFHVEEPGATARELARFLSEN